MTREALIEQLNDRLHSVRMVMLQIEAQAEIAPVERRRLAKLSKLTREADELLAQLCKA